MFATLRYNSQNDAAICVERTTQPPLQGQGHQHSACDNCRAKKLRCTGQKTGCDRCSTKSITCVYSASIENKGSKRRRRAQTSADNTTSSSSSSSSSSSLPVPTTKAATSKPAEVKPPSNNAPRANRSNSLNSYEGDTSARNRSSPARSTVQNIEELDSCSDSGFMELLETVAMDVETTESGSGSTFKFSSSFDADEFGQSSFFSGLSPFEPGVEDFLCFESELESTGELARVGNALETLRSLHKPKQHALGDSGQSSFDSPPSGDMQPTSRWPLPSPPTSLAESPGRIQPLTQNNQHAESALPSEDDMFGSLSSISGHNTTTSQSSSSCQCMQCALRILEELEVKNSRDDLYAADHVLSFQKRALGQCNVMLSCKNCSISSGFMMLLVVICEKMVSSFEKVSTCVEQLQRHPTPSGGHDSGRPRAGGIGDGQAVSLGDYEIDSLQERCCLVSVLVLLQLKRLGNILVRLKNVAALFNWGTHLTMLLSIDRRFRGTTASLHMLISARTT